MVDNPLVPGTRTEAVVNIRATALEWLASREKIDSTQKAAGERFARLYRTAEIGGTQAIRYAERVQTSGADDPLTDQVMDAGRTLARAMKALGKWASPIVVQVLGLDLPLAEVAKRWSDAGIVKGDGAAGFVAERLREALQQLAEHWGMAAAEGPPEGEGRLRGTRGQAMTVTGPPREFAVSICGDVVDIAKRPGQDVDISGMTRHPEPRVRKRARHRKR